MTFIHFFHSVSIRFPSSVPSRDRRRDDVALSFKGGMEGGYFLLVGPDDVDDDGDDDGGFFFFFFLSCFLSRLGR